MWRSRELRAERWKLLAKHKEQRLKEQQEIASLLRKIRRADASDLSKLKSLDILLDRAEPDLRHVMDSLQHYLHVIQRTPGPPPQVPPKPDPDDSDPDEPRAKTESVDDTKAKQDAILKVPEDDLRALIKLFAMSNNNFLCNVWDILEKKYKLPGERFTIEKIDPRPKRPAVVEDANLCDKCDKAFLVSENGAEACLYHFRDSEVYLDSGEWDGWDDLRDGEKNWAFHRKRRGFWYPCSGTTLDKETSGCRTGRHWGRDDRHVVHIIGRTSKLARVHRPVGADRPA